MIQRYHARTPLGALTFIGKLLTWKTWTKGSFYTTAKNHDCGPATACKVCLLGALHFSSSGDVRHHAHRFLLTAVREFTNSPHSGIATFNDQPETTLAEIKEVVRRAKELARG